MKQDMALAQKYLARRDTAQKRCVEALPTINEGEVNLAVLLSAMDVFV